MINPISIAEGAIASIVGSKTKEAIDQAFQETTPNLHHQLEIMITLLGRILQESSIRDNPDLVESTQLQLSPLGYTVGEYRRNHLMMLVPGSITITILVPGMASFNKTLSNAGWYQVDLPHQTLISASGSVSNVLFKWSDAAHGISL